MYVPVQSQEPVIEWLSFDAVLHICFCILIRPLVFSFELFYIDFGTFYSWLCVWPLLIVEGRTIAVNFWVILVSCGELSHWQLYHIFFFHIHNKHNLVSSNFHIPLPPSTTKNKRTKTIIKKKIPKEIGWVDGFW